MTIKRLYLLTFSILLLWTSPASAADIYFATVSQARSACQLKANTNNSSSEIAGNDWNCVDNNVGAQLRTGSVNRDMYRVYDFSGECSSPSYPYEDPATGQCTDNEPIPECPADTYYDEGSGECVEPPDLCYDDIVTGEQICEPMWPDETPEQCVMNDGVMLCLPDVNDEYPEPEDPDLECIVVDGVYTCNQPDEVCGVKNGTYQCVNPEEEGCGYFNGERMCFDPEGEPVPPDSPDHPDNGGNLDGDPNNDVTDNRTPEEGGDPDKQPGYIPPTEEGQGASEKTARDNLNENRKTADNTKKASDSLDKIKDILNQEKLANQDGITGGIDQAGDEAIAGTGVDEHIQGIGEGEFDGDMVGGAGDSVTGALPGTGSCTDISAELWPGRVFEITCADTARIRDLLSWVFYISTVWYLFNLVTNPPQKGMR